MTDKSKGDPKKPSEISEDDLESVAGGARIDTAPVQVIILQPSDPGYTVPSPAQVTPIRVTPIKDVSQVTPVKGS